LRKERYTSFTPGTEAGQALLDAILKERRLELAFENDRWYTLKRLGLSVQRSGKGDIADGNGSKALVQTLANSYYGNGQFQSMLFRLIRTLSRMTDIKNSYF
jgi:hypothetical protein